MRKRNKLKLRCLALGLSIYIGGFGIGFGIGTLFALGIEVAWAILRGRLIVSTIAGGLVIALILWSAYESNHV